MKVNRSAKVSEGVVASAAAPAFKEEFMNTYYKPDTPGIKMAYYGPQALSNSELLSLMLRTGAKGKTAMELANDVFQYTLENSVDLATAEVSELKETYGIGDSNANAIVAAMELGRRLSTERKTKLRVRDSSEIAEIVSNKLAGDKREHFIAFYLNSKLEIEQEYTVSIGNLDSAPVHPREVFGPAIKRSAAAVIVAHNHPSGDPSPSTEDFEVTKRLKKAGELLGIRLLDHVIVGDGKYTSMKNEGVL